MPSYLRRLRLLALLILLAACGGDDPSGPNPDPDPDPDPELPGDPIAAEDRMAAFEEIQAELIEIGAQGMEPAAFNAALAAYLETRPEFMEVGVDTASSTVWAIFTDGRGVLIPNNLTLGVDSFELAPVRVPGAAREAPSGSRARARVSSAGAPLSVDRAPRPGRIASALPWDATEMPTSTKARLIQSFDAGRPFGDGARAAIARIGALLEDAGWQVTTGGATVAELRDINDGDGYFYINTHGGAGSTWDRVRLPTYALQTGTVVTLLGEVDSLTQADLDAGRLVYMWGDYDGDASNIIPRVDLRYAITPKFVQHYMSFAPGAVVVMNACFGGNTNAETNDMVQAFRDKGASVVISWTKAVNAWDAWHVATYLTDRMLGSNDYEPEASLHRPFTLEPVMEYLTEKGLDRSNDGVLRASGPISGAGFGMLRPTIERLQIDTAFVPAGGLPFGALTIHGSFGNDPGDANRRVFIRDGGEVPLTVLRWTADSVTVMPKTGVTETGFVGDVVVEVRGIESNPRRLNAWLAVAHYTFESIGTLQYAIEMEIIGRFDVDSTRSEPGEALQPNDNVFVFRSLPYPEMQARWSASGEAAVDDCTMMWSGSETILSTEPTPEEVYILHAEFDPTKREILLRNLQVSDNTGYSMTCGVTTPGPIGFSSTYFLQSGATDTYLRFDVDDQWNLQSETMVIAEGDASLTFEWPDAAPTLPLEEQPR